MKRLKNIRTNSAGVAHHYIVPIIVIIVLTLVGVRVYMASHAAPRNKPVARRCLHDPSAQIESLAAYSVWNGNGKCYKLASGGGINITKPVTIENGTFIDPLYHQPGVHRYKNDSVRPIININKTSNVTLNNLVLEGENSQGNYNGLPWVGEEGIKLQSSTNVNLTNIQTSNTYGDGLYLGSDPRQPQSSNVKVYNYTVTNAGREGVTVSSVANSTLNNVNVVSADYGDWDFESDTTSGSGNITVNNANGNVRMIEALRGPITFNNSNLSTVTLINAAALSKQQVTINNSSVTLRRNYPGTPPAGIYVNGPGNLALNNVKISFVSGTQPVQSPAWIVVDGGTLVTHNVSVIGGPYGVSDSNSHIINL